MSEENIYSQESILAFEEHAHNNFFKTCTQKKRLYAFLSNIHAQFEKILDHFKENPFNSPNWLFGFFILRTHASFLAATRMACSGQFAETFVIIRNCLENALYGLYISKHPEHKSTWLDRHKSEKTRRKLINAFKMSELKSCLESEDVECYRLVNILYERSIDCGGHPNVRSVAPVLSKKESAGKILYFLEYLTNMEEPLNLCQESVVKVGIYTLEIFGMIIPDIFNNLRINKNLGLLKKEVAKYIEVQWSTY